MQVLTLKLVDKLLKIIDQKLNRPYLELTWYSSQQVKVGVPVLVPLLLSQTLRKD